MLSSETISRDMSRNSEFNPNTLNKHVTADLNFTKSRDFTGSDYLNQPAAAGLARYRSAPSSFLASLMDSTADNSSSGDECEAFFSALMEGHRGLSQKSTDDRMQFSTKQEVEAEPPPGRNGYESVVSGGGGGGGAVVGSNSLGMESQVHHVRLSGENGNRSSNSSLVRQSSSPAGIFNGFGVMGEVGNYKAHNHVDANSSSPGLSNHVNFSSTPSSTSRFMPTIPENGNEKIGTQNGLSRNGNNSNGRGYDSWSESPFNALKRDHSDDLKMFSNFNGLGNQDGEARKKSHGLVSHLSLSKTSSELAGVENLLQFQQETTIPLQIRAKRGFATHPRSIAERMRRTRISENMKKLQDLFPNMAKQTSTAEMLDLAVEYIKDLQKRVQTLNDMRAMCVCSSKPQQTSPTT